MKPIKMLGLAVVAAIAAMAMLGAASASAGTFPKLCKVANETPCAAENIVATPFTFKWKLSSAQIADVSKTAPDESCQASEVEGKLEEQTEDQLKGHVTNVTWTSCSISVCFGTATVKAIQLPWRLHLQQKKPDAEGKQEQNNGNLYVGPNKEVAPAQTESPGYIQKCTFPEYECELKVQERQPKQPSETEFEEGQWGKMQFLGGNPAHISAALQLKLVARRGTFGSECGAIAENAGMLEAEYELTEPKPAYLTHQTP